MDPGAPLEEEYRGADDVLLQSVAFEVRRGETDPASAASRALELAPVAVVLDNGLRVSFVGRRVTLPLSGWWRVRRWLRRWPLSACVSGFPRWPLSSIAVAYCRSRAR